MNGQSLIKAPFDIQVCVQVVINKSRSFSGFTAKSHNEAASHLPLVCILQLSLSWESKRLR